MTSSEPSRTAAAPHGAGYLSLRRLTRRYERFTAVDDLDLDVAKGELVAFLGPSGCGKTTSLRMIAGLVPASSGRISVDGRDLTDVPPHRRDMGLVFQSYALFPHMDIAANVAFGLEMRKVAKADAAARVAEAIAMVRLTGRERHRPAQLSGGQQQRVALARALVIRPSILLLDEPLSNLDAKLRDEMRNEIRDIQKKLGITAIFVTHDQVEALTICDKVVVMNQGRLEQIGTPHEIYEQPRSAFVAGFVGRINRLPGRASGGLAQAAGINVSAPGLSGEVDVMVRPHRIAVSTTALPPSDDASYRVTGTIMRSTFAGDLLEYEVSVGGSSVRAETVSRSGEALLPPGTPVTLSWDRRDTLVYGAA
ncbi:spermidine/putrescine ABC transporter ATP-binding protein [Aureimonas ureilytica]|uniref:Spermidine/putrescine ABC transporter ATP-binding protein n=1 Tax=Aureimonas ureilytica TaxID=401562 RepID=A0A175R939_9HYPH|nr:ABC transporter ATP-binding protein [Aureimonas ureilytica]KTQ95588.1 spermidine/putrescine ABC transporter ATP-binding protein [Aureimonas ureilytica]